MDGYETHGGSGEVAPRPKPAKAAPPEPTFRGAGFGTRSMRTAGAEVLRLSPDVVSQRALLRLGLPAIYQDSDFSMRFIRALEEVMDPVVGTLDGLHHYVDPDFAPRGFLELLCAWLGVATDETQSVDDLRRVARSAAELGRRRGTVRGLALALSLEFPDLPLRIEDEGGVTWPGGPGRAGEPGARGGAASRFAVYCDQPIPEERQAAVARCIEREKPVHAGYRLRVKSKRKPS